MLSLVSDRTNLLMSEPSGFAVTKMFLERVTSVGRSKYKSNKEKIQLAEWKCKAIKWDAFMRQTHT